MRSWKPWRKKYLWQSFSFDGFCPSSSLINWQKSRWSLGWIMICFDMFWCEFIFILLTFFDILLLQRYKQQIKDLEDKKDWSRIFCRCVRHCLACHQHGPCYHFAAHWASCWCVCPSTRTSNESKSSNWLTSTWRSNESKSSIRLTSSPRIRCCLFLTIFFYYLMMRLWS